MHSLKIQFAQWFFDSIAFRPSGVGCAKFMFPAGNAMARSLTNLISGGEPTIHQEAERIRNAQ